MRPFGRRGNVCACGKPARFLCDALIPVTREERWRRLKAGEHVGGSFMTCDAPLCEACRVPAGATFIRERGKACHEADGIDHCPAHALPARPRVRP